MKVKNVVQLCLIILGISLLLSCTSNTNKNSTIGTISDVNTQIEGNNEVNKIEEDIIFSTKDLETAKRYSPDEYPLKTYGHDGKVYDNQSGIYLLPDYKNYSVVIERIEGGDNIGLYLSIVKEGTIQYGEGNLSIGDWSEPEGYGDYRNKYFEISSDFLIRIDTEEKTEGKIKKYTNYYRINDDGDFYEVKD